MLKKCETMLISCYQYLPSEVPGQAPNYRSFPIIDSFIYQLTEADKKVIKDDYDTIFEKINSGHAEDISESDTNYLAACTKSSDSHVRVKQYGSSVEAKPRAFSLKSSFLTAIIERYISNAEFEAVEPDSSHEGIEEYILSKLRPYFGKSQEELSAEFPDVGRSKSQLASFVSRILGKKDLSKTEEFQKANIHIKTVRVEKNGSIRENMSFEAMDFIRVAGIDFEDSDWHSYFEGAKFLFIVFENNGYGYTFKRALFYNVPDMFTEGFFRYTYERTQTVLRQGNIVSGTKIQIMADGSTRVAYENNFVGSKENPVCHVRPHARDFHTGQHPLPVTDRLTGFESYESMCFWLDRRYVQSILEGKDGEYLLEADKAMAEDGHPIDFDL